MEPEDLPSSNSAFVVSVGSEPTIESSIDCSLINVHPDCKGFDFNHIPRGSEERSFVLLRPSRPVSFVEVIHCCGRIRMYPACLRQLCAVIGKAREKILREPFSPIVALETMMHTEHGIVVPVYDENNSGRELKPMLLPTILDGFSFLLTTYRPPIF